MVVAEAPYRSLIQDQSPDVRAFLRFFGTLCSIPTVERIGYVFEGGQVHHWVRLNDDDEDGQNAIYDALRRFQAAEGVAVGTTELHVVFADEDPLAFPPEADVLFVRE
jgi:hypothetical protein